MVALSGWIAVAAAVPAGAQVTTGTIVGPAAEDVAFLDDPTLVIATCTTPTELSVEDETTEVEGEEVEGEAVDADGDAESSSESGDSSSSGE